MSESVQHLMKDCNIPDNTELQERLVKTNKNIVIGDRCIIDYGLEGRDILVSEFSSINGNIITEGDIRIGNWCEIAGNIIVRDDAYLGEGVKVHGRLTVDGDLDIGDNVTLEEGFEAKGWISIRNPMPVIVYIILYLVALLHIESHDDLESLFEDLFDEDAEDDSPPLMIPANSILNTETFTVPGGMTIGSGCRLHGNIRAQMIAVDGNTTIFGSLRAKETISINDGTVVHGNLETGDSVRLGGGVHILGDIACKTLTMHENTRVDGLIQAPAGLKIERAG